jgi:predicted NAD-dependent protein-ADP-ribosyltransferase YbiA (DUF1768 family)
MKLEQINDLSSFNRSLQNTLAKINEDIHLKSNPIKIGYLSRKFTLYDENNHQINDVPISIKEIIEKFKILSENRFQPLTTNDKKLINTIHDNIVMLDLLGVIKLEKESLLSGFFRNFFDMSFFSTYIDEVDSIQSKHLFDDDVKDKAKEISDAYKNMAKSLSRDKDSFENKEDYQNSKKELIQTTTKEIFLKTTENDEHFEKTQNALRYLALKNPLLALEIFSYLRSLLNSNPYSIIPLKFANPLNKLIDNLILEISARPEFRYYTIEREDEVKNIIKKQIESAQPSLLAPPIYQKK